MPDNVLKKAHAQYDKDTEKERFTTHLFVKIQYEF